MEREHTEQELLRERSRVDQKLWNILTQSLKDMESDYEARVAIIEVNGYVKMHDLNNRIHANRGTYLGMGLYGNDSITCALRELRNHVKDAWPMYRESTMEEMLEAEEDYRRACEG